jgi:hypothetical protein
MAATIGSIEDNSFIRQIREETEEIKELVKEFRKT